MKETASQRKKDKVLRTSMYVAVLIGLAGFLIFSILAAITFGNADLSLKDVYSVIAYKLFHIKSLSAYAEGAVHDVVWLIRLPRVLLALAVGMALSVCGVAGYRAEPAGRPVCAGYLIWCISGCHTGHHAWNRKLSWWKLCGNHSFHWRDDHFFCGDRHCKHGWKGNFRKTDPCGNGGQRSLFCFFQFCHLYYQ